MNRASSTFSNMMAAVLTGLIISACGSDVYQGTWDYEIHLGEQPWQGQLKIEKHQESYRGELSSFELGKLEIPNLEISDNKLFAIFKSEQIDLTLEGIFKGDKLQGTIKTYDQQGQFYAIRQDHTPLVIDRSKVNYILSDNDLSETESNIDHAGVIGEMFKESYERGARIYNTNCINCHGIPEIDGSIPSSLKFWEQPFKSGEDPYSMYQTITRGVGSMPPQLTLTPREKYDVINYIREEFVRENNKGEYFKVTSGYLTGLPKGTSKGPEPQPYRPWSDQNYGNFFINTYELVDHTTGPERYHSPGPVPYEDEDYSQSNFAYKGIAVRLDSGPGGVSKGSTWMIFDHDLMRVAGGWTGEGFIDWEGILLNDRHETYPRTIGKLHFQTPVAPGWANPANGSFDDPRFIARDGRQFGPLPKKWADYKGLYRHGDRIIISYTVGTAKVLEELGVIKKNKLTVFTRTLNISPSTSILKLRVAPEKNHIKISGEGASLSTENGYVMMNVKKSTAVKVKLFITEQKITELEPIVGTATAPESLLEYTSGGPAHYPEEISSPVIKGSENGIFAVDQLVPPFENPWHCRMKLSGIDFMKDRNKAVACTTDGDIWLIKGLTDGSDSLSWRRIGAGLFQPLGIKVLNQDIYVTCRDQIVRLKDFNEDQETDFYESFNHDHQVTDHFHEFAMGLQADKLGNLYYAKSGRHAREALIPQHGTLIKVSKNGAKSEIIAKGFRAANGVCINPDGSFIVTDQQGFWNPMNRINWVKGSAGFYGNMWGYDPPQDTSRLAMEPPMVWVDMEFDRSPSELLWVESDKWGPLDGRLLSFSYGYGKIQMVLTEKVIGQMQGGVIDLPGINFLTGVMRGRFNSGDGHLYACGMSAWGTNQMMKAGGLYRIKYTGKLLTTPIELRAWESGIELSFASSLDTISAKSVSNYKVETWDLVRSSKYGSDRYNVQSLAINKVELKPDGKTVKLYITGMKSVDIMTIQYNLANNKGIEMRGTVQNTIHNLSKDPDA